MEKKRTHNLLYYIEKFDKLDKKKKILLYISFVTLISLFYYYFYLSPSLLQIENINKKIIIAKRRLNDNLMLANKIQYFRKEKKSSLKKLDKLLQKLPNNNEIPSLLADISEAGRSLGLQFTLFQPEEEIKQNIVICLPITLHITGDYFNLLDFLNKIASLPRLVNIDNISIELIEENLLSIHCKASTYKFINND